MDTLNKEAVVLELKQMMAAWEAVNHDDKRAVEIMRRKISELCDILDAIEKQENV